MIEKRILFTKESAASMGGMYAEPPVSLLKPGHTKISEVETPLHEHIKMFIKSIQPSSDKTWVLINALGAGEFYGDNINGDYFPYKEMVTHTPDFLRTPVTNTTARKRIATQIGYGYPTFYNAHIYKHHINKDPSKSFGNIELAVWNEVMKRVELVVCLIHALCEQFGAMDIVNRINDGEYPDTSMGCAKSNALILLPNSTEKEIRDVEVGDHVVTHLGRTDVVTEVMRRHYEGVFYHLHTHGTKKPLVFTEEHPIWVLRKTHTECRLSPPTHNKGRKQKTCAQSLRHLKKGCDGCQTTPDYKFEWVEAKDVEVGDYVSTPVLEGDRKFGWMGDSLAELMGHYLAEGFVLMSNGHKCVEFCLGLHEKNKAERLEDLLKEHGAAWVHKREVEDRNGLYVRAKSTKLYDLFRTHIGHGAKDKQLSEELIQLNRTQQKILLGAYADGDGGEYEGSLYFSTSSSQLARQLQMVLLRHDMVPSVNRIVHTPSAKSVVKVVTVEYQVWVGKDTAYLLDDYTNRLDLSARSKKVNSARFFAEVDGVKYLLAPVTTIDEEEYSGGVYNFEVANDHSYVAEGFGVHNCRVPYDVCSICGNKAKTKAEYCEHINNRRKDRDPRGDGQRPYMINIRPKYFDNSFVFIGADRTARMLMKIAGVDDQIFNHIMNDLQNRFSTYNQLDDSLVKAAHDLYAHNYQPYEGSTDQLMKVASQYGVEYTPDMIVNIQTKTAAVTLTKESQLRQILRKVAALQKENKHMKLSDLIKYVVPNPKAREVSRIEGGEPDLPEELQDEMADKGLSTAINSSARKGIVLKPHEFMRIALRSSGLESLADKLKGFSPAPTDDVEMPCDIEPSEGDEELENKLLPMMSGRSISAPVLVRRIIQITVMKPKQLDKERQLGKNELLDKISAAYNGYRLWLLANSSELDLMNKEAAVELTNSFASASTNREVFDQDHEMASAYLQGAYWQAGGRKA